jgi:choice-of-anchor C domain-containing protein
MEDHMLPVRTTLSILAALAMAAPLSANLLTNGSFETASGVCTLASTSLQCIDSWQVASGNVHRVNSSTFWPAQEGQWSLDLDGSVAGAVQQTFATLPGTSYLVTFAMAGNFDDLPVVKPMRVSADGQSADFTFDTTGHSGSNMGWVQHSWTFVADDLSATLQFQSLTAALGLQQGWGATLDNVSVTAVPQAVPEPSTCLLLGMGLAGMACWRKRVA